MSFSSVHPADQQKLDNLFHREKSFDRRCLWSLTRSSHEVRSRSSVPDPDHAQRAVGTEEEQSMYRNHVQGRLPGISDRCETAASCLYTATPDSNFVIDVHPENDRIIIASPCSGHGFKHAAAIGEALAEQVIDRKSKIDISSFSLKRFKHMIQ
ncbi:MAG: FAD-dependent oxidoreductase [Candidatus Binatia bacterium]